MRIGVCCLLFLLLQCLPLSNIRAEEIGLEKLGEQTVALLAEEKLDEAEKVATQALTLAEAKFPANAPEIATYLNNLAAVYRSKSQYEKAEPLFKRALSIREQRFAEGNLLVANSLAMLARLYMDEGHYDLSAGLQLRAIKIRGKLQGPRHADLGIIRGDLGQSYYDLGRYKECEIQWRSALAINEENYGKVHEEVAVNLNNLGTLFDEMGQATEAEPLFLRALAIREKVLGPDDVELAGSYNGLGTFYYHKGDFAKAEAAYLHSVGIVEKKLGVEHPLVAIVIGNLASVYEDQGRMQEAIALHLRELAIGEKTLGPEHPDVATTLNNLGLAYLHQGDLIKAEAMMRRSLAISEKVFGPEHGDVSYALSAIAGVYMVSNRFEEALPLLNRSLAIDLKAFGPNHPKLATTYRNLASTYEGLKQYDEANRQIDKAIAIQLAAYGPQHPELAQSYANKAKIYFSANNYSDALIAMRQATGIMRQRFSESDNADSTGLLSEHKAQRSLFTKHLEALSFNTQDDTDSGQLAREGFEIAQLARASSVGQSLAQMAARFSQRGDALAVLIREQQDTRAALSQSEKQRLSILGMPADKRDADSETKLRGNIERLRTKLNGLQEKLHQQFPSYSVLISQAPVSVAETQKLLGPQEAMLVYTVTENRLFAWLLRPESIRFRYMKMTATDLNKHVQFLRSKLLPNDRGQLPAMTPVTSSRLYQEIFAAFEPDLVGIKHIFLVTEAGLQSLPFGVLGAGNVAAPEWLAKRYAFAVLPSVSALRALRSFKRGAVAKDPFVGFGDPVLNGDGSDTRNLAATKLFATRSIGPGEMGVDASGIVDVEALRKASPLPDTANELKALSKSVQGSPKAVFLQAQATESRVKQSDLARYRFIAFATHGVMAGELSGIAEPGLVLTPPKIGSVQDDGYLSASEVAQLKLNADWVLLSACNTAAPDGSPGAEGLSGLAKAFFYAGSRSLLVSNWPVSSKATEILIADTMQGYVAAPDKGKAEALQSAELEMMQSSDYSHPFFWAPFSVVGD